MSVSRALLSVSRALSSVYRGMFYIFEDKPTFNRSPLHMAPIMFKYIYILCSNIYIYGLCSNIYIFEHKPGHFNTSLGVP